jgi:hypothetical protein
VDGWDGCSLLPCCSKVGIPPFKKNRTPSPLQARKGGERKASKPIDVKAPKNFSKTPFLLYHALSILKMSHFPEKKFENRMDLWNLGKLASRDPINFSAFSRFTLLQLPAIPCKIQIEQGKEALA